ncbi:MAG: nuclease-related domain-containing protein, partial [Ilumatobacteraceae bacterium]
MSTSDGMPPDSSAMKAELLRQRVEHWDKGEEGERMVAAALDALPPAYRVFHQVGLPNTQVNVDHIVVGPGGVIAVDSKYYEGALKHGSGTLWRGKYPIRKECETARWEADVMSTVLQHPVESVLCFVETSLPEPIIPLERVVVTNLEALTQHLLTMPNRLSESEIDSIAANVGPAVRATAPRTVVSVSTTPDVTTGSARPGALPRRQTKQPRRFFTGDEPRKPRETGVAVSAAFAIVFLLVMWVVWTRFDNK